MALCRRSTYAAPRFNPGSVTARRGFGPNPRERTKRVVLFPYDRRPVQAGVIDRHWFSVNTEHVPDAGALPVDHLENIFMAPGIFIPPGIAATGAVSSINPLMHEKEEVHALSSMLRLSVESKLPFTLRVTCFKEHADRRIPFEFIGLYSRHGYRFVHSTSAGAAGVMLRTLDAGPYQLRESGKGHGTGEFEFDTFDGEIFSAYKADNAIIGADETINQNFPPIPCNVAGYQRFPYAFTCPVEEVYSFADMVSQSNVTVQPRYVWVFSLRLHLDPTDQTAYEHAASIVGGGVVTCSYRDS